MNYSITCNVSPNEKKKPKSFFNFTDEIKKCIRKIFRDLKNLNIIIIGKTGVGKSTLINTIFRDELAKTGIGEPVTSRIKSFKKDGIPLTIYDTPGLELDSKIQESLKNDILKLIRTKAETNDVDQCIHCILYCINTMSNRFEAKEEDLIRTFTSNQEMCKIPVIVVLTQTKSDEKRDSLIKTINRKKLNVFKIVPILAVEEKITVNNVLRDIIPSFGLEELIHTIDECLPEMVKDTLSNVQIVSMLQKRDRAFKCILASIATASVIGSSPIPFSDSALLIPLEIAMISGITLIYGKKVPASFITGFFSATIGSNIATFLGKTLIGNLVKFIPILGTFLGSYISGVGAGIITGALGNAYIPIIEGVYKGEITINHFDSYEFIAQVHKIFLKKLNNESKKKKKTE